MTTKLPLAKQFLALHFCDPTVCHEWLREEFAAHDADLHDFYRMRAYLLYPGLLRECTLLRAVMSTHTEPELWQVRYSGLRTVSRSFPTRERAEQWARQAGVYGRATITEKAT